MPGFIYAAFLIIIWISGRNKIVGIPLKHGGYTKILLPGVLIFTEKLIRRDFLNYGARLMLLYGIRGNEKLYLIHWSIKISSLLMFSSFPFVFLSLDSFDSITTVFSLTLTAIGFILPDLDLYTKIKKRKASIMKDYIIFCTDIAIMTGAGLEITKAWERASERESATDFYKEARHVLLKTVTGTQFAEALKDFSSNLALSEIHTFVTIVNQEIKSGSGGMAFKLGECAKRSWKTREDIARKKGEEAASKLVFPLAMGLMGILLILAAPAVLIMKGV